jgi:hypothetical protein
MNKTEIIVFMNWVSKNYTPGKGIGYWFPSNSINGDSITTPELLRLYLNQNKDE